LQFAVKTGKKQERNENTEKTQNKDLSHAHADGISENLAKPDILIRRNKDERREKAAKH
jgi:hypothetical protein